MIAYIIIFIYNTHSILCYILCFVILLYLYIYIYIYIYLHLSIYIYIYIHIRMLHFAEHAVKIIDMYIHGNPLLRVMSESWLHITFVLV